MSIRPVTLYTLHWADVPLDGLLAKVSEWGYDGVELGCRGDHFDVCKALDSDRYVRGKLDQLSKHGLKCYAISDHLTSACVCDFIDGRHKPLLPPRVWGDGRPEGVRQRAAEEMKNLARAAKLMGVGVVIGLSGSSIWGGLYPFPPPEPCFVDRGFEDFAQRWLPILDVYREVGVRYALEPHPTQIAYDIVTAQRALQAVKGHPSFGYNFDPSHLVHQFVDPVMFIHDLDERIFHVHIKDTKLSLNGRSSILCSHLGFGDARRGWDFVTPGRGDVEWDQILRALVRIGYAGPLSVEIEDPLVDRDRSAREALSLVRRMDFEPSDHLPDETWSQWQET